MKKLVEQEHSGESYQYIPLVQLSVVREKNLLYHGEKLGTPQGAAAFIRPLLQYADREYVIVCCADSKMQPVSVEIAAIGSLDACIVEPREIFKNAVLSNAACVLLFHNHPSGNSEPSYEDEQVTRRIKAAGELMGIPLKDHIIWGQNEIFSFWEKGML